MQDCIESDVTEEVLAIEEELEYIQLIKAFALLLNKFCFQCINRT